MRGIIAFSALLAIASAQSMLDGFSTVRKYNGICHRSRHSRFLNADGLPLRPNHHHHPICLDVQDHAKPSNHSLPQSRRRLPTGLPESNSGRKQPVGDLPRSPLRPGRQVRWSTHATDRSAFAYDVGSSRQRTSRDQQREVILADWSKPAGSSWLSAGLSAIVSLW